MKWIFLMGMRNRSIETMSSLQPGRRRLLKEHMNELLPKWRGSSTTSLARNVNCVNLTANNARTKFVTKRTVTTRIRWRAPRNQKRLSLMSQDSSKTPKTTPRPSNQTLPPMSRSTVRRRPCSSPSNSQGTWTVWTTKGTYSKNVENLSLNTAHRMGMKS